MSTDTQQEIVPEILFKTMKLYDRHKLQLQSSMKYCASDCQTACLVDDKSFCNRDLLRREINATNEM